MTMLLSQVAEITPGHLYLCAATAATEENVASLGIGLVINATSELPLCPYGGQRQGKVRVVKVSVRDKEDEKMKTEETRPA